MDKEFVKGGCECIQQLLSIMEGHIHWDDFSFEEQEDLYMRMLKADFAY